LDDAVPRGVWGLAPAGGKWDPKEVWFYAPGEESDVINWKPHGVWVYPPGKLKRAWPPPTVDAASRLYDVGKLPKWNKNGNDDRKPQAAWVHPEKGLPVDKDDWSSQGMWKYAKLENRPDDADDWSPQKVWMYPKGQEPDNFDDGAPHGVWGLAHGAQPKDERNWDPQDVWFYGPGEEPDNDDWNPQGIWTYPPGKLDIDWPPTTHDYKPQLTAGRLNINDDAPNEEPLIPEMPRTLLKAPIETDATATRTSPPTSTKAKNPPHPLPENEEEPVVVYDKSPFPSARLNIKDDPPNEEQLMPEMSRGPPPNAPIETDVRDTRTSPPCAKAKNPPHPSPPENEEEPVVVYDKFPLPLRQQFSSSTSTRKSEPKTEEVPSVLSRTSKSPNKVPVNGSMDSPKTAKKKKKKKRVADIGGWKCPFDR
jgi:hypothetical protein